MPSKQLTDKQKANCWDLLTHIIIHDKESNKEALKLLNSISELFSTGMKLSTAVDLFNTQSFNNTIDKIMGNDDAKK